MPAVTEVPGVNSAVEKLEELADRMRGDEFGFRENDVSNIDRIIESLRELENERSFAHDKLEKETIKASILRHKLQFLPQSITKEITDAVTSARDSNAEALNYLRDRLDKITKNIVYLEQRQKQLDEENAVLHPERELVRQQHEEIISQLNQRMADKASMQIQLNETRDKVRQTNQEIVDLEDGILQLKEDLIQERTEARNEKKHLKKAVENTSEKTKEQRVVNREKKKELDQLHEKLMDSEGRVDALRKSLRRYETSKAKLEGQERALNSQLQKQLKQNEELRRRGADIINEDLKLQKEFADNEKQLIKKLKRLESEIERETSKFDELDRRRQELQIDLEEKLTVRKADAERVADLDDELQAEKRQLALKAEEVGRMQAENIDMQEQIENLADSHKAVLAQLNKQIEDYREQLSKERKDREMQAKLSSLPEEMSPEPPRGRLYSSSESSEEMEVQERKNSVSKELEDFKTENQKYMQDLNKSVQQGKTEHIELSNEEYIAQIERNKMELESQEKAGMHLQKELRDDEAELRKLEAALNGEQEKYQKLFTNMQNKVETMEREIIEMEHSIAEKEQELLDKTPGFEAFQKEYDERTELYEKNKKDIVVLKNQKMSLQEQIAKAEREKDKMTPPQEQLRTDLKKKRELALHQLKKHGQELADIEREIYVEGCKQKTVMEENQKFEDACRKLEAEINDLNRQMEGNESQKQRLDRELSELKDELVRSWNEDTRLTQHFSDRDQRVVDDLGDLLNRTEKREVKISDITGKLQDELGYLSSFLDNLASRRPKGTPIREDRKPISFRLPSRAKTMDSQQSLKSKQSPHPPGTRSAGSSRLKNR